MFGSLVYTARLYAVQMMPNMYCVSINNSDLNNMQIKDNIYITTYPSS